MAICKIIYEFTFQSGRIERFQYGFDKRTFELLHRTPEKPPEWIKTGFHQCPNCTLDPAATPYCPQATNLLPIIRAFDDVPSYEPVKVKVVKDDRVVSQNTTVAKGVSSLMGLLIATCGCPVTRFFIPMGRFHLPLASQEETLFRASASYLLGQYFLKKSGRPADLGLDGLLMVYDDIQIVNQSMLERLRTATQTDSTVNALILLDVYAKFALIDLDECLEDIRRLFEPFMERFKSLDEEFYKNARKRPIFGK